MFCKYCGAQLPENASFCIKCGAKVNILVTPKPREKHQSRMFWIVGVSVVSVLLLILAMVMNRHNGGSFGGNGHDDFGGTPWAVADSDEHTDKQALSAYVETETTEQFISAVSDIVSEYGFGDEDEFSSCRLILSCETDIDLNQYGPTIVLEASDGIFVLQFENEADTQSAYQGLADTEGVNYVEPDHMVSIEANADISNEGSVSWGTPAIGADLLAAAMQDTDYESVVVAVVDTGVALHEMLTERLISGWDTIDNDASTSDRHGHGTHVAGIVVDATQGLSIPIMPVRVLDERGFGSDLTVSLGIRYAVEHGADVINLSLGGPHSYYKDEAVAYAIENNCVVVAAAGNHGGDTADHCPAHIEECMTVSSIDSDFSLAYDSKRGEAVDFCAPGVLVNSSVPGGYDYYSGTSMAAPHISALAAMVKAADLAGTCAEVMDMLSSCVLDLGSEGWDPLYGYGLPQTDYFVALLQEKYGNNPGATLRDGSYRVEIDPDDFYVLNGHLYADAELINYIYLDDREVSNLQAGDTIDLTDYGWGTIEVMYVQYWDDWSIDLGGGCLYQEVDSGKWRVLDVSDIPFTYKTGEITTLRFADDVTACYMDIQSQVLFNYGLIDCYSDYIAYEQELDIVIEDGEICFISTVWTPAM